MYILDKAKKIDVLNSNLLYNLTKNAELNIDKILNSVENEIGSRYKTTKQVLKKIDNLWDSLTKDVIGEILEA